MKSDLALFKMYDRELAGNYNKSYYALDTIKSVLSSDTSDLLDMEACQVLMNDIMAYLPLKKRYLILKREVGDKLSVTNDGFKLYDKTFSSIDELEKAYKMKAFL